MYIEAQGKVYTFYEHAVTRMRQRKIMSEWIEAALQEPDDTIELTPNRLAYDKMLDERRAIRVVVDEGASQIVTVYFTETEG